ncbi:hypothetical protein PTRA_a1706 [Pseudoalteromonas translucida KMM 520]|uniref:Uncharacterized protein n=1 Tax=Pseudoalteromonas translucida KMM 520 TaxID=1315283 RepID=A0A0U2WLR3_9GAMM|nr:hypothetical protein PTRA_a1706 [Pseudoalteromonas translucida KMM 520]
MLNVNCIKITIFKLIPALYTLIFECVIGKTKATLKLYTQAIVNIKLK